MRLIIVRCANGVVVFRSMPRPTFHGIIVHCLNDGAQVRLPVPPISNIEAALEAMATHAVALKGAIQQVFELTL